MIPAIIVDSDFDGYFEALVRQWLTRKVGEFKYKTIRISAGPYRPDALTVNKVDDDTVNMDFYSALRSGFGRIDDSDVDEILKLL